MIFDPDIHRRRSIRLRGYDYAREGAYFVTVCVQGRQCLFGEVSEGEMVLNEAGLMLGAAWEDLPGRFPGLAMDAFVIMPNHCHAILCLHDRKGESGIRPGEPIPGRGEPRVRPFGQKEHTDQGEGDRKDRPY